LLTPLIAEQILQRNIGDRLAFASMPSGAGHVTFEGWTETLTHARVRPSS
jgi:hypothetical protein